MHSVEKLSLIHIFLTGDKISMREKEGTKIWHIIPGAGKQGKPVVVIKRQTGKKYNFDSDSAALYAYHIFVYENGDTIDVYKRQSVQYLCRSQERRSSGFTRLPGRK